MPVAPSDPALGGLLDALRARLAVVADHGLRDRDPAAHLAALREAAARVDRASAALSDPDPELAHFLQRQSLTKAIDWISARAQAAP